LVAAVKAGEEAIGIAAHQPWSPDDLLIRATDLVGALALFVFLLPLLAVVSIAIRLTGPGPVLFRQVRIGRDGQRFACLKFRTMVPDAEPRLAALLHADPLAGAEWARDHKLRRDPRVTPLGRLLRKSSMDELPQLLNVLRGEMSLVGPRPIVEAERVRYGRRFADYCRVKPGITGLWQISGRSGASYRRRVALDVRYARRRSFALHCRILLLTVPCVLLARGSC